LAHRDGGELMVRVFALQGFGSEGLSMAKPTVKFNYRAARHGGKAPTIFLTTRYLGHKKNLVK
jgi:hypothetical protein